MGYKLETYIDYKGNESYIEYVEFKKDGEKYRIYAPNKKLRYRLFNGDVKDIIPKGYFCNGDEVCPFLQFRKITNSRLKLVPDIPFGNKHLQYCAYLKKYLWIQDCIKDCGINEGE